MPTFRPDRALDVHDPAAFGAWLDRLAAVADIDISRFADLLDALSRRHQAFHDLGGRLSDHGLTQCPSLPCTDAEARAHLRRGARAAARRARTTPTRFASYLMRFFGRLDAEKGWTKQLHLGALRNVNSGAIARLGRDTGYDSIGDWPQAEALGRYLDDLDREGALPRTIVYNLNPGGQLRVRDDDRQLPGRPDRRQGAVRQRLVVLDQEDGMRQQMDALSNAGLLSHFVGMTTDSRSFMSFPRHEYFRRTLCNLLGHDVERGTLPRRSDYLARLVEDVCYRNAERYFRL